MVVGMRLRHAYSANRARFMAAQVRDSNLMVGHAPSKILELNVYDKQLKGKIGFIRDRTRDR